MRETVIITCAVTGSAPTPERNPNVPVTPEQIATSAIEAGRAGAAIAHIHVRDPETGAPSRDLRLYQEVVERIRGSDSDIIINLTGGAGGRFMPDEKDPTRGGPATTLCNPVERLAHVMELRPEICSLDVATMNMGEVVFMNVPAHLREMAAIIRQAGARPELEIFDIGGLRLALHLIAEGHIDPPPLFQLVTGVAWGAPSTPQAMAYLASLIPEDANWAAFGASRMHFPMAAQAALLGGHVRVGFEDTIYIEKGVLAESNAQLVEKAARILTDLGARIATPAEAREMLALRGTQ